VKYFDRCASLILSHKHDIVRPTRDEPKRQHFCHHHHNHIRLINDLSAASITKHKTYTIANDYKNKCQC